MKMIFHYPGPFFDNPDTGEKIRPQMMLKAFQELGLDVTPIYGDYCERKSIFNSIKNSISSFDFIYSENSNLPLRLTNKFRIPTISSVDFKLFNIARRLNVPTAVFYRDIYWKFPFFKTEHGLFKSSFGTLFYKNELNLYSCCADIIFVPSDNFAKIMPLTDKCKIIPLPPAAKNRNSFKHNKNNTKLHILYVGSISPPTYDLSLLIDFFSQSEKESINLTVITRHNDIEKFNGYYKLLNNIKIQTASGEQLMKHYQAADISVVFFKSDEYRKLCMPLKLFESIEYGLPIISYGDTAASSFIKTNNIGWVVDENSKDNIFCHLLNNPDEIKLKTDNVIKIKKEHTWIKRAETVIARLQEI
jgi:glycosyltransferase involved in cell wall biosynthesis